MKTLALLASLLVAGCTSPSDTLEAGTTSDGGGPGAGSGTEPSAGTSQPPAATFAGSLIFTTTTPVTGWIFVSDSNDVESIKVPAGWPGKVEIDWRGVASQGLAVVIFDETGKEVAAAVGTTSPLTVDIPAQAKDTKMRLFLAVPDLSVGVQIEYDGRVTFG